MNEYLHSFSPCCLPNLRNTTYSSSRLSKVIDLGVNSNRICNFLLVINSNFGHISYTVLEIENNLFFTHPRLTPRREGTSCDINVICTPLKIGHNSTVADTCLIRLAAVGSQIREIPQNSERIRSYSRSRSSEVIDLGVNWNRMRFPISH